MWGLGRMANTFAKRQVRHLSATATPQCVPQALASVNARIDAQVSQARLVQRPRLVAVSKFHSAELVKAAYATGHRHFGENYVQELVEKSQALDSDIHWHFIGHLQSNKAKTLVQGCKNLAVVESVDSAKLANKLNTAVASVDRPPLAVFIQVNTSGEASKSGVEPGEEVALAQHIEGNCKALKVKGLMTIGMPDYTCRPENMECLKKCRQQVAAALQVPEDSLELSMGMSGDFEAAILMGSTNVRVGSSIFGPRPQKATEAASQ